MKLLDRRDEEAKTLEVSTGTPFSLGPRDTEKGDDAHGRIGAYRVNELHPHPSYERHNLAVSAAQLAALAAVGELAFRDPLLITRDRTIVDGYARWKLAQLKGRPT